MNPRRAPDPRSFMPERYLNNELRLFDSAAKSDGSKQDPFTFGAGRRICPGIHVAERSWFLGVARMLWAFDIKPEEDAAGQPILPDPSKLTRDSLHARGIPGRYHGEEYSKGSVCEGGVGEAERRLLNSQTQWTISPLWARRHNDAHND